MNHYRLSKLVFQNNKILLHISLTSIKNKENVYSNKEELLNKKILREAIKNLDLLKNSKN